MPINRTSTIGSSRRMTFTQFLSSFLMQSRKTWHKTDEEDRWQMTGERKIRRLRSWDGVGGRGSCCERESISRHRIFLLMSNLPATSQNSSPQLACILLPPTQHILFSWFLMVSTDTNTSQRRRLPPSWLHYLLCTAWRKKPPFLMVSRGAVKLEVRGWSQNHPPHLHLLYVRTCWSVSANIHKMQLQT